jgi:hypothetical protein
MDFFKGLMQVKENFLSRNFFLVGNITNDLFFEEACLCDLLRHGSVSQQYLSVYNTAQLNDVPEASVISEVPLNIGFRRVSSRDKCTS